MELLQLGPLLLALLGAGQHCCPQATSLKVEPDKSSVADIKGREVFVSQELTQNLPPNTM